MRWVLRGNTTGNLPVLHGNTRSEFFAKNAVSPKLSLSRAPQFRSILTDDCRRDDSRKKRLRPKVQCVRAYPAKVGTAFASCSSKETERDDAPSRKSRPARGRVGRVYVGLGGLLGAS